MNKGNYQERTAVPPYVTVDPKALPSSEPDPNGAKWSAAFPPPPRGDRVRVKMNNIGQSTVVGYFTEYGYLGLLVKPLDPPPWYVRQNGRDALAHVFGAEIDFKEGP